MNVSSAGNVTPRILMITSVRTGRTNATGKPVTTTNLLPNL